MTATDLRLDGLRFSYPPLGDEPPRQLFEGLTIRLEPGQTGVLLGTADVGKTTLSRMLVGLVPRFTGGVREGGIRCGAVDVCASKPWDLVETIGMVFQDSDGQVFTTRCDTEVAFALESLGLPRDDIAHRIEESLGLVGLAGFRKRNPSTLSGGERKRLLVACLAAIDPGVWVLDESLEELDAAWKVRIMDILRDRGRTTLVLDSRWSALLEERGDRFGILSAGTITCDSGRPVSGQLRSGLQEKGIAVPAGLAEAPGRRPTGTPFLKAEGIRFSFPDSGSFDLEVGSLVVEKGTVCGLVGPNGSGKSTLGKVLCGLLAPAAGGVALNDGGGFRLARTEELNRRIGYLFQNPDHQIYLPTVQEELGLGLAIRGVGRRQAEDLIREAARLFGLPDLLAQPALMSYGARRRLQAATYWLLDRDMLILDEVDSGLSFRELADLTRELCARIPCILLITHDAQYAAGVCDRVVSIDGGRLVGDSRPSGAPPRGAP
jgi:energy-coupling factor transport system ATP-binding protein